MSAYEQRKQQIELYSTAVSEFFLECSGEAALVRSVFLLDKTQAPVLWNDFNSFVSMEGVWVGSVCVSASRKLLSHVLLLSGRGRYEDEEHLGVVDQIATQFARRTRLKYGSRLRVSAPEGFCGRSKLVPKLSRASPCAITFSWRGYEAGLVVDVDTPNAASRTVQVM